MATSSGVLLKGAFTYRAVTGLATLTTDHLTFGGQRLNGAGTGSAAGGVLGVLGTRRAPRTPEEDAATVLEVPVADISTVARGTFRLHRNVLVVGLADGREARIADGFKDLADPLRRLLAERYGRTITAENGRSWRVG